MIFTVKELYAFAITFDEPDYKIPTSEEIELCIMRIVIRDLLYK